MNKFTAVDILGINRDAGTMETRFAELKTYIGQPYEMFFEDNNYLGCFFPVYFIYPTLPRYPLKSVNHHKNFIYGMDLVKKHAEKIEQKEILPGDILICEYNNELHSAVLLSGIELIHVFRGHTLQINKIDFFTKKDKYYFRIMDKWR